MHHLSPTGLVAETRSALSIDRRPCAWVSFPARAQWTSESECHQRSCLSTKGSVRRVAALSQGNFLPLPLLCSSSGCHFQAWARVGGGIETHHADEDWSRKPTICQDTATGTTLLSPKPSLHSPQQGSHNSQNTAGSRLGGLFGGTAPGVIAYFQGCGKPPEHPDVDQYARWGFPTRARPGSGPRRFSSQARVSTASATRGPAYHNDKCLKTDELRPASKADFATHTRLWRLTF